MVSRYIFSVGFIKFAVITIIIIIIIIIIIFLQGLCLSSCSGIDALPSFPRASKISSSSRFIVEGVFRESGVVRSFKMVDPVLFVFGSHVLYSRDLQLFSYNFASYFVQSCVSFNTSQKAHLCSFQASHASRRGYPCFAAIEQCWSTYDFNFVVYYYFFVALLTTLTALNM